MDFDGEGSEKEDILLHHMHSMSSSYGEKLVEEEYDGEKSFNDFIEDVYKNGNFEGNHFMDYFQIRKSVDKDINLIFNDTTHHIKEDKSYDFLYEKVKEENGEFRKFDKHVYFEVNGKEAAVINSSEVEVSDYGHERSHFTVTGLEMGYEEYNDITLDQLTDLAKEAEMTSVAHPYMPFFQTGKELLYGFLEETKKGDFEAAINYATGYFPLGNILTRGEIQKYNPLKKFIDGKTEKLPKFLSEQLIIDEDLKDLAEKYDLPLIPEIDGHSMVPKKLQGSALLKDSAMKELREGDFPSEKIFDVELVDYGKKGISMPEFLRMYSEVFPGFKYEKGSKKGLKEKILSPIFNYYPEEYKEDFYKSLESLKDVSVEDIRENSYDIIKNN